MARRAREDSPSPTPSEIRAQIRRLDVDPLPDGVHPHIVFSASAPPPPATLPMDVSSTSVGTTATAPTSEDAPVDKTSPCEECSKPILKGVSCIASDNVAHDWQGRLPVICQECFESRPNVEIRDLRELKKFCKARWAARKEATGGDNRRARTSAWSEAPKDIDVMRPGENRVAYRKRLMERTMVISSKIAAGILKSTPAQQEEFRLALHEWQEDMQKRSEDPTYIPELRSIVLTDEAAQFAHRIVDGLDDYFICRHTDCAFVCPSADWIRDAPPGDGGHFSCPRCGLRYYPWRLTEGRSLANKVWVMRVDSDDLLSGGCAGVSGSAEAPQPAGAADAKAPVSKFTLGSLTALTGDYMLFPTVWADTATQTLTNKFKEITLNLAAELEALPPRQRIDKVIHTVADMDYPAIFKRYELSETVRRRMDDINRDRAAAGRKDLWRYDHLLEGFCGVHLPADQLHETFTMEDMIRTWGCSAWLEGQMKK